MQFITEKYFIFVFKMKLPLKKLRKYKTFDQIQFYAKSFLGTG